MARNRNLRIARQGVHDAPPGGRGRRARHLRRPRGRTRRGYLRDLGITAVELLPIHAFIHDRHLVERGLRNYWGYNTIGFFAPHPEYLGAEGLGGFKAFVQQMHDAGIEVILDVVYNHTAEGNQLGPTLSFRGIDNKSYYYLMPGEERYYSDFTGTGNALELRHPYVLRMVMDSLRYWVQEMGVDGFRFDLATTLARVDGEYTEHAGFLDAMAQDPALSGVKLIAEPWDTGTGGYQVGNFPPGWAEWNDQYRDTVRRFWKGDEGHLPVFASRFSGSADIHDRRGRRPWASINFVTAHDGFTLRDLVSYNEKHNEANKEDNQDGSDNNNSWNCGAEGPTDDPEIAGAPQAANAQFPGDAAAVAGGAHAARRRRVRPKPGRQQQRLLPGQRNQLARLGGHGRGRQGAALLHPQAHRCFGAHTSSSIATGSSTARPSPAPRSRTSSGFARTAQRCRRRTGETPKRRRSRCGSAASPGLCT